jgi:hypothetical protein
MRPEVNMSALGAHLASARRQQHLRRFCRKLPKTGKLRLASH